MACPNGWFCLRQIFTEFERYATRPYRQSNAYQTDFNEVKETLGNMTFGQLHNRDLTFPAGVAQPYKRCLAFHAHQAVRRAVQENFMDNGERPH